MAIEITHQLLSVSFRVGDTVVPVQIDLDDKRVTAKARKLLLDLAYADAHAQLAQAVQVKPAKVYEPDPALKKKLASGG